MDNDLVTIRAQVAEQPWRSVLRRFIEAVDLTGNVLALVVAAAAAVGVGAWAEWWLGVIVFLLVAVLMTCVTTYSVLVDRNDALRAILARPEVAVAPAMFRGSIDGGELSVHHRVLITNNSSLPCRLVAKVVAIEGVAGPEVPWPLPWRHGSEERAHRLFPGDAEMLLVAIETGLYAKFQVLAREGRAGDLALVEHGHQPYSYRVTVWDADTGQVAADFRVVSNGDVSGRVEFTDLLGGISAE